MDTFSDQGAKDNLSPETPHNVVGRPSAHQSSYLQGIWPEGVGNGKGKI